MVAARIAAPESLNLPAPRARPASVLPFVPRAAPRERRAAARAAVALFAWVCTPEGSGRAYALNVSTSGAQLAGSGVNAAIGARVLVKLVCDPAAAALVLPARVVRSVGGVLGVAFVGEGCAADDSARLAACIAAGIAAHAAQPALR